MAQPQLRRRRHGKMAGTDLEKVLHTVGVQKRNTSTKVGDLGA